MAAPARSPLALRISAMAFGAWQRRPTAQNHPAMRNDWDIYGQTAEIAQLVRAQPCQG